MTKTKDEWAEYTISIVALQEWKNHLDPAKVKRNLELICMSMDLDISQHEVLVERVT